MLRKQLAAVTTSKGWTNPFPSSSFATSLAPFRATPMYLMFQNQNVQNQWTNDNVAYAGRRSDYDFDKERWAKQMKFASMDCIMEPSIVPPKYTNFEGIKKNIRRYMNMKKLAERRPGFHTNDLKELFIRYKYLTQSKDNTDSTLLLRLTTHTEATRIEKEIAKRANEAFKSKSWGSMKLNMSKSSASTKKTGSPTSEPNLTDKKGAETASTTDSALASAASHANDVVLLIRKPANYDIHVTDFQLVTSYMAQMAAEDWLQLTFKTEYFEKETCDAAKGADSSGSTSTSSTASPSETEAKDDKASIEKNLLAKGYTKVVEYPCFELRMGDGATGGVQYPFIVLGVMRRDGTRYGRDAQDAAQLRKQFDRNRSWFS